VEDLQGFTDEELLVAFVDGRTDAFAFLYRRYEKAMLTFSFTERESLRRLQTSPPRFLPQRCAPQATSDQRQGRRLHGSMASLSTR
jgi:hypothetical protein